MIEYLSDGSAVITLAGEIDIDTCDQTTTQVQAALEHGPSEVVLHMRDVTFIDATALGALVRSRGACVGHGASLVIAEPGNQVLRLLRMTHLDTILRIRGANIGTALIQPGRATDADVGPVRCQAVGAC